MTEELKGLNGLSFEAAVFMFRAANTHFQLERGRLVLRIHDATQGRAAFWEREGKEKEEGFTVAIESARAELCELEENYRTVNAALRERWGDVFD